MQRADSNLNLEKDYSRHNCKTRMKSNEQREAESDTEDDKAKDDFI